MAPLEKTPHESDTKVIYSHLIYYIKVTTSLAKKGSHGANLQDTIVVQYNIDEHLRAGTSLWGLIWMIRYDRRLWRRLVTYFYYIKRNIQHGQKPEHREMTSYPGPASREKHFT